LAISATLAVPAKELKSEVIKPFEHKTDKKNGLVFTKPLNYL